MSPSRHQGHFLSYLQTCTRHVWWHKNWMPLKEFSSEAFYFFWLSYPAASERLVLSQARGLAAGSDLQVKEHPTWSDCKSLYAKVLTTNGTGRLFKVVNTSKAAHEFKSRKNKHHSCHYMFDIPEWLLLKSLQTEVLHSTEGVKGELWSMWGLFPGFLILHVLFL